MLILHNLTDRKNPPVYEKYLLMALEQQDLAYIRNLNGQSVHTYKMIYQKLNDKMLESMLNKLERCINLIKHEKRLKRKTWLEDMYELTYIEAEKRGID